MAEEPVEAPPAEKGLAYLQSIIDEIEKTAKEAGLCNEEFDTSVPFNDNLETIKVVKCKVVFGDGKDLDKVLDEVSPFQLAKYLQLALTVLKSYIEVKNEKPAKQELLELFGSIYG